MSADAIIYCLERVAGYRDFERFCWALLAGSGYPGIDPLGGTGDGGRDAIIRKDGQGRRIVFAYTVRSDWRAKFEHDCMRVREMRHEPDAFVFVCTEGLSTSEKDSAHRLVSETFGWTLDLFDLERQSLSPKAATRSSSIMSQPIMLLRRSCPDDCRSRASCDGSLEPAVKLRSQCRGCEENLVPIALLSLNRVTGQLGR